MKVLIKDPLNMIIAGVGGQGNVTTALLLGNAMIRKGYFVTVADTLGAAQRGGMVTSHIRVSSETQYGALIPQGAADIILGMEPVETLRMLAQFTNPNVATITNPRPIYPINVLSGKAKYPDLNEVLRDIKELSNRCWIINATDEALEMGSVILANVIMIGALVGSGLAPLDKNDMECVFREAFPKKIDANMMALTKGIALAEQ